MFEKDGFIYHPNACRKTTGDKMNERCIPGIIPVEWREYRYIADDGSGHFVRKGLFEKLVSQITLPIPAAGGVITENCSLWLPTGELFHALSYKGDIEGWRRQIELGANTLGLLTAKIDSDRIWLSDRRHYELATCQIKFY